MAKKKSILIYCIIMLLVFESFIVIYLSYNSAFVFPNQINELKSELNEKIGIINSHAAEIEANVKSLNKSLSSTQNKQKDLTDQIGSLTARSSADFSGIIGSATQSVVSIKTDVGQGTGFIIATDSKSSYIVTNAHVLSQASYANAIMSEGQKEAMYLVGYNKTMDIALLKIPSGYDYLTLKDSDSIKVGEKVIAIGNPLGLGFSVTEGIVSGINRQAGTNNLPYYIQTDASLNPGNSGGPLISADGKVIGINNFKARSAENIGFALESNYIKEIVNQIALDDLNKTLLD